MPKVYVLYSADGGGQGQGGEKEDEEAWSCRNWTEYACLSCFVYFFVIIIFLITVVWIMSFRDGFGFDTSEENIEKLFNVHPFMMIFGFVVLEGISITLFRICRCCRRIHLKLAHFIFHLLVMPCAIVGWFAINTYNTQKEAPRLATAHAIIGLLALLFYFIQFAIGAFTFLGLTLCNRATAPFREDMIPLHASFGILNYAFNIMAVCTGMQGKLFGGGGGGEGESGDAETPTAKADEEETEAPDEDSQMFYVKILLLLILFLLILIHYIIRREELRYRAHLPNFQEACP